MNKTKLLLGKISYINASPVYYGLDNGLLPDWITMTKGAPSVLNKMIKNKELDISPVSAAFYAMNHKELMILPDLSISCFGNVLSVILMSNYKIKELNQKKVLLSKDSATAAALVKSIFSEKNIKPVFYTKKIHDIKDVSKDTDAILVIGDTALTKPWNSYFKYKFDLGNLWYKSTNLPFVFALWVVRKSYAEKHPKIVKKTIKLFYKSREQGFANMDTIIKQGIKKLNLNKSLVREYYDLLYCNLDDQKIKSLKLFFSFLHKQHILPEKVILDFF